MNYDNIKIQKNQGFNLSLEDTFLEKPQGRDQIDPLTHTPSLLRVTAFAPNRAYLAK